ncbi:MAG: sigma-70 family RNA polymerase sigma factor [Planctomycetia bacterium]|nr:sigma-70 family RNA polymerase sigma factor [Planctomycetia bacterium]
MIAHATKARPKRRSSAGSATPPVGLRGSGPRACGSPSRSVLGRRREALFDRVIDYVPCRQFLRADAERLATIPPPAAIVPLERQPAEQSASRGLSPYLAGLYRTRLLTKEEEQFYFRRMNWLKFRAATARGRLDRGRATLRQIDQIEGWLAEAETVKGIIITSNLRLVVSIAKKFVDDGSSFDDLVGEGNVALMRAVEKFSFALGNRFSTYATYAIQRHFFRLSERSRRHRSRFVADERPLRERPAEVEPDGRCSLAQVGVLEELFRKFLGELEPRERQIVVARFGFDGLSPRTFRELGTEMGVCKERIRQIQSRAIDKLRVMAAEVGLEQTVGDWL